MRLTRPVTSLRTVPVLIAAALLLGCQGSGVKQTTRTTDSLETLRADAEKAKGQIDSTVAALDALAGTTSGDLKKPYDAYKKQVAQLQSLAKKARDRSADMHKRADAYTRNWNKQLTSLQNDDLRHQAEQAQARAQQRFEEIRSHLDSTRATFQSFMTDLEDIQNFLDFNLNAAGIASIQKSAETARHDAAAVNDSIDDLIAVLDRINAAMSTKM